MKTITNLKFSKFGSLLFFLTLFTLFPACEKDLDQDQIGFQSSQWELEQQEMLEYFANNGYDLEALEFQDDHVVYENDIVMSNEDILRRSRGEYSLLLPQDPDSLDLYFSEDRQRALFDSERLNAVSRYAVQDIKIFIRNSVAQDCGNDWLWAILNARNSWNSLSSCLVNIRFTTTLSEADIIIASDLDNILPADYQNLASTTVARGTFPSSGGSPGEHISINDSHDLNPRKQATIMHEIGHCLGFHHTGTNFGQHVHGTPSNQTGSVMNQFNQDITATFRSGDVRMARLFYPGNLHNTPTLFSASRESSGEVRISYRNNDLVNRPYYWIRVLKYNTNQIPIAVKWVRSTPNSQTGLHTFTWSGHTPGPYFFSVRGYNFRRDRWSNRTNRQIVFL